MHALALAILAVCAVASGSLDDQYADMVAKRNALLNGTASAMPRDDPWKHFRAAWPCPAARRYGTLGDGGKWVCFVPPTNCTVLSLGINNECSFETEMHTLHKGTVVGYDVFRRANSHG